MSTPRSAQCGEDVAAYALGALDDASARSFERHLRTCDLCRTDLAALQPAVDSLPTTAEPVDPPPQLKKRIMAVVEAEAKQRRGAEAPAKRRFTLPRLAPAFAAAAAAAVIAVVVLDVSGGDETKTLSAEVQPPGAKVELRMDDGRGTLVVEGVGAPEAGRVFQVWKQRGNQAPEPTDALFTPTSGGRASVAVPGDMDGVDRVLVSTEPQGGSPRPTTAASIVVET